MENRKITGKDIRAEYWKKRAEKTIRDSVPEVFGAATLNENRDAFDGIRTGILQLTCIARVVNPKQISVGIYIKSNDSKRNKRVFDYMYGKKEEIRKNLPYKDVTIEPADGKGRQADGGRLHYNLLVTADASVLDKENWDFCRDFHSKVAKALYDYVIVGMGSAIQAI